MGTARQWNGNTANFISGEVSTAMSATGQITFATWAKVDAAAAGVLAFAGRFQQFAGLTHGQYFRLDADTGKMNAIVYNNWNGVDAGHVRYEESNVVSNFKGVYAFYAAVFDGSAGTWTFYFGKTPNSVAAVGSSFTQGSTSAISASGSDITMDHGRVAVSPGAAVSPFNGNMAMTGVWRIPLTLAQLKTFANCNLVAQGDALWIHRITGASPEPNDSTLTGGQGTINGTVPVVNELTGCDIASAALKTIQAAALSAPPATAGASGLNYDEGSSGASLGPEEGYFTEPPSFNPMHRSRAGVARTILGKSKLPKVAKRYFGLDHLAYDLRTKRGHKK